MIFKEVRKTVGRITIDGFSNRKSLKSAIKELAKEVEKFDVGEAMGLINMTYEEVFKYNNVNQGGNAFDYMDVPSASRYIDDNYEEVESAEANWYLCFSFVTD